MEIGLDAVLWYLAFVLSTTLHEASHALAALRGGDPTAYLAGQVSLNPLPHMRREPFGMVVAPILFLLMNGWAVGWASAPYDPRWERRHPRRAAWMAAAGPAANLVLAIAAFALLRLGLEGGVFVAPEQVSFSRLVTGQGALADGAGVLLSILLVLNAILFAFNLIPFPPLDGATAATLLLPERLAERFRTLTRSGGLAVMGLLLAWLAFGRLVGPLWSALVRLVHPELVYR